MNKIPKVSVVISTYNQPEYLCQAIESVLSQTYTDYEIVVVDDGSDDATREAVQKYGDHIRYFYQENQGPTCAEISGIGYATGEYIASLDQDDLWLPNLLETQVKILDQDPDLSFVCSAVYTIDTQGEITGTFESGRYCKNTFESLLENNFVQHSTVVLRKKFYLEVGGFDVHFTVNHDHDLWLRLAKKYKYFYHEQLLTKYRLHERNITKKLDGWLQDSKKIFKKKEIIEGVPPNFLNKCIARMYHKFGGYYNKNHDYGVSSLCYLKATFHYPLIGAEYWPEETQKLRFTFPYRVLKVYMMIMINGVRSIIYFIKNLFVSVFSKNKGQPNPLEG